MREEEEEKKIQPNTLRKAKRNIRQILNICLLERETSHNSIY